MEGHFETNPALGALTVTATEILENSADAQAVSVMTEGHFKRLSHAQIESLMNLAAKGETVMIQTSGRMYPLSDFIRKNAH